MEDNRKVKKVIAFLCILFGISIVGAGGMLLGQYISAAKPVLAQTDIGPSSSSESEAPAVTPGGDGENFAVAAEGTERKKAALFKGQNSDKSELEISGVEPGDKVYRAYELKVTYSGTLAVRFGINVTLDEDTKGAGEGSGARLADALMARVNIGDKTFYEGALSKMPKEITYILTSPEKTTESLNYDIYIWLSSLADGAFRDRQLKAELCWWVDEGSAGNTFGAGRLEEIPDTGAPFGAAVFGAAAASLCGMAVFGIVGIGGKKKKRAKK